jgi:hypothetical protein
MLEQFCANTVHHRKQALRPAELRNPNTLKLK